MLMEPIYERSAFVGFSYGFRPGRSQHNALDALAVAIESRKVNWVLEADIRAFFDTIDHAWLRRFVEHRIGDERFVRLLMKWLHAGVMEDGELREVREGTPQGGIISPLLANLFLHYALDLWVQQWRKRHARGEMYIVRYADDFVMGFQHEEDARAMRAALAERSVTARSSASNCTPTRRACSASGDSPEKRARAMGGPSPKRSTSSASRTSAERAGPGRFSSGDAPPGRSGRRSSRRSVTRSVDGDTIPSTNNIVG